MRRTFEDYTEPQTGRCSGIIMTLSMREKLSISEYYRPSAVVIVVVLESRSASSDIVQLFNHQ